MGTDVLQQMIAALLPFFTDAESVQLIVRRAGVEQQWDASWLATVLATVLESLPMPEEPGNG